MRLIGAVVQFILLHKYSTSFETECTQVIREKWFPQGPNINPLSSIPLSSWKTMQTNCHFLQQIIIMPLLLPACVSINHPSFHDFHHSITIYLPPNLFIFSLVFSLCKVQPNFPNCNWHSLPCLWWWYQICTSFISSKLDPALSSFFIHLSTSKIHQLHSLNKYQFNFLHNPPHLLRPLTFFNF